MGQQGGVAAVLVTAMAVGAHGAAKPKLNLLFIMADDLNADWKNDRLQWMPNLNKCVRVRGSVTHCKHAQHAVRDKIRKTVGPLLAKGSLYC